MSKFFIKQAFAEAMDLQKNGRLSEAKEIYLKILGQSPNDANALHLISLVFMAEGNYDEAKSYIEQAINEAPDQAVFPCCVLSVFDYIKVKSSHFNNTKLVH